MLKEIHSNKNLYLLVCVSTFLIVLLSGYFSIVGISSLFSGKKLFSMIMAISFEVSKVTIITLLSVKWKLLQLVQKMYLLLCVVILVVISSSGIYSYLAQAYQLTLHTINKTNYKLQNIQNKNNILLQQRNEYQQQINSIEKQIQALSAINSKLIQTNKFSQQRKNTNTILNLQSLKTKLFNKQLEIDSLTNNSLDETFSTKTNQSFKQAGTLLKIAQLFNKPMDKIVQFLLFLIIIIFDPLGILFLNLLTKRNFLISEIKEETNQEIKNILQPLNEQTKQEEQHKIIQQNEIKQFQQNKPKTKRSTKNSVQKKTSAKNNIIGYNKVIDEKGGMREKIPKVKYT